MATSMSRVPILKPSENPFEFRREVVVIDGVATRIDVVWFADRLLEASLQGVPTWSKSVAVDGTDIDTWGKLHGELDDTDFDGDLDAEPDESPSRRKRRVRRARHARILGGHFFLQDPVNTIGAIEYEVRVRHCLEPPPQPRAGRS